MEFPAYTGGYIDFCWLVPSPPGSDTSGPPGHLSLEIQSISTRSPTSLCGAWWLVDFRFNSTVNYMCTCIYIYIYICIYTLCTDTCYERIKKKGNIRLEPMRISHSSTRWSPRYQANLKVPPKQLQSRKYICYIQVKENHVSQKFLATIQVWLRKDQHLCWKSAV